MPGIGFLEIVVIALVAFIVVGPGQLPAVMRKLAVIYRQFVALRDELRFQILSADTESALEDKPKKPKDETELVATPRDQGNG